MNDIQKINCRVGACIGLAWLLGCNLGHEDRQPQLSQAELDRIEAQLDAADPVDVPVPQADGESPVDQPSGVASALQERVASPEPSAESYEQSTPPVSPAGDRPIYTTTRPRTTIGMPVTIERGPAAATATPAQKAHGRVPQATTADYDVYYSLRPNETVWDVANAYQVPEDVLLAANRMSYDEAKRLPPGTTLFVPGIEPQPAQVALPTANAPTTTYRAVQPVELQRTQISVVKHRVSGGETLSSLARLYSIPVEDIVRENAIEGPVTGALEPGTVLRIPAIMNAIADTRPTAAPQPDIMLMPVFEHRLAKGETLSDLAARYEVDADMIMVRNGLNSDKLRHLYAGDTLLIPQPAPR